MPKLKETRRNSTCTTHYVIYMAVRYLTDKDGVFNGNIAHAKWFTDYQVALDEVKRLLPRAKLSRKPIGIQSITVMDTFKADIGRAEKRALDDHEKACKAAEHARTDRMHACPFLGDVDGDGSLHCRCCTDCQNVCAQEV